MYFNLSSRWAMVGFAITIGLSSPPDAQRPFGASPCVGADQFSPAQGRLGQPILKNGEQARLREGSKISPTVGRFIPSDNQWFFQPETPLGIAKPIAKPFAQNGSKSVAGNDKPRANSGGESSATKTHPAAIVRFLVLENLALQRVAQTISQDPSDDRWSISGIVTEYFGENRVLITTAARAPLPVEPSR